MCDVDVPRSRQRSISQNHDQLLTAAEAEADAVFCEVVAAHVCPRTNDGLAIVVRVSSAEIALGQLGDHRLGTAFDFHDCSPFECCGFGYHSTAIACGVTIDPTLGFS